MFSTTEIIKSSHEDNGSAPIPIPVSLTEHITHNLSAQLDDSDSGYGGSPPHLSSLPKMKDSNSKPNEIGETGFYTADGKRELTELELKHVRETKMIVIITSMAGRTFEPTAKYQTRDNSYPERLAAHIYSARQKDLPAVIGLAEQWLNIVRAYVPVGPNEDAILKDCFDKDANFSERLNILKKEIYTSELKRREIDISKILHAMSEEAQKSLFQELVKSDKWKIFTEEMAEIGIKVSTLPSRIEEPEPDFSWKRFINQVDPTLVGETKFNAKHPALKDKITKENLTHLVKLLEDNTGLTEQWVYYLLTIFSEDLQTIKNLNYQWYNSWEDTQTSTGEKKLGMKHNIIPIVESLTNGQALYAGYITAMAIQYQRLDWFAYRHKFEVPLEITAFGPGNNWESASQSPEYFAEYEKYCTTMDDGNGATGTLDDSVTKTFTGGQWGAGYDSTTEYTNNLEKAFSNEAQEKLLKARCKILTRLHQVRENVMVLALPYLMSDISPSDPTQGKRRPIIYYPHNKEQGWESAGTIIHNYHKHMDNFEKSNPPKNPPKILRAEFGVLKSKPIKNEEAKKTTDNTLIKEKTASKQKDKEKEKEFKKNAAKQQPVQQTEITSTIQPDVPQANSTASATTFIQPSMLGISTGNVQTPNPVYTSEQVFFMSQLQIMQQIQQMQQIINTQVYILTQKQTPILSQPTVNPAQLNMPGIPQQTFPQSMPSFFPGYMMMYPQFPTQPAHAGFGLNTAPPTASPPQQPGPLPYNHPEQQGQPTFQLKF